MEGHHTIAHGREGTNRERLGEQVAQVVMSGDMHPPHEIGVAQSANPLEPRIDVT